MNCQQQQETSDLTRFTPNNPNNPNNPKILTANINPINGCEWDWAVRQWCNYAGSLQAL